MAEFIAVHFARENPLLSSAVTAASAGTSARGGAAMSVNSEQALEIRGIPFQRHHSRRMDHDCLEAADLVLGMESAHIEDAIRVFPGCAPRAHTLKGYAAGVDGAPQGGQYDILDPFGQPLNAYLRAEKEIEDAVRAVLERIAREHFHTGDVL